MSRHHVECNLSACDDCGRPKLTLAIVGGIDDGKAIETCLTKDALIALAGTLVARALRDGVHGSVIDVAEVLYARGAGS